MRVAAMNYRVVLTYVLRLFFGLLYPTAKSIEAVETGHDDTQWLMFWVISTMLVIAETLLWPILKWVPLYQELKIVLLAWLVLPHFKGATWVYEAIVAPGLAELKKELVKFPAIERMLTQHQEGQAPVLLSEDDAQFYEARKKKVQLVVEEAHNSLTGELDRITGITDPKAKQRAQKAFDKDVTKIGSVLTAQKAHMA